MRLRMCEREWLSVPVCAGMNMYACGWKTVTVVGKLRARMCAFVCVRVYVRVHVCMRGGVCVSA